MFKLLPVLFLFAPGLCVQIKFHDCGSSATVKSLILEPCSSVPCHVQRNATYTGTITIVPKASSQTAVNNAIGLAVTAVGTTKQSFGDFVKDACNQGLTCPLVAGTTQTYQPKVTVPGYVLTPTRWIAKWQLIGDNNQTIVCLEFPIRIDK